MALFKKTPPPPPSHTVIGPKTALTGALTSQARIEVHGTFDGPATSKADLSIEPTGRGKGDVTCRDLLCLGSGEGRAAVAGLAAFGEASAWRGEIRTARLSILKGARIEGLLAEVPPSR